MNRTEKQTIRNWEIREVLFRDTDYDDDASLLHADVDVIAIDMLFAIREYGIVEAKNKEISNNHLLSQ